MKRWGLMLTAILILTPISQAQIAATKPQPRVVLGEAAPEIQALTPEGKPIALAGLGEEGKVLVLQFGSQTEPVFRSHLPAVEKLAEKSAKKAVFVIIYQQEAHAADTDDALEINVQAGFSMAQPLTLDERQKAARQTVDRLKIKNQRVIVDAWNNASALRYGSLPNMTFLIDASGKLQAGYPWMDPGKVEKGIELLASGKPLPPELRGSVRVGGAAPLDYTGVAMEMTGGRGVGAIALAIDNLQMTLEQKQAIYPTLGQYSHDLREFRDARERAQNKNRGAAVAATGPGAALKTPEEALEALRSSAVKLKNAIKENLSAKDAKVLLDALEQGNAQRLFRD